MTQMHSCDLKILAAQFNPIVGAIANNAERIKTIILHNQEQHHIIVFPELALTGYPLEDVLFRSNIKQYITLALQDLALCIQDCYVVIGHPEFNNGQCYNAASVFYDGTRRYCYYKQRLPNFGVFDELRYFTPGPAKPCIFNLDTYRIGVCICEDIWHIEPIKQLIDQQINVLLCINASPYETQKYSQRLNILQKHAKQGIIVVYVNMVGGQDELIFDGQSLGLDSQGDICTRLPAFIEDNASIVINQYKLCGPMTPLLSLEANIYQALCLSVHDYIEKHGIPSVILGLSGGIDSALTLAIAVDALGASRVRAIIMPSRYNNSISLEDAVQQTTSMQVQHTVIPIESAFITILDMLSPVFDNLPHDVTEENLQARIRGLILMAISNKFGSMVLTTSNKSEIAVGYTTLYGDMAGGFNVLKDIYKTQVYALAQYRNSLRQIIPLRVISRPASAELAENQTDQDSLPPYIVLDKIIQLYMEDNLDSNTIITQGYAAEIVMKVISMLKRNEYKRRQAPVGPKITNRSFGKEWRYPITNQY